jgi:hypothetical protein
MRAQRPASRAAAPEQKIRAIEPYHLQHGHDAHVAENLLYAAELSPNRGQNWQVHHEGAGR